MTTDLENPTRPEVDSGPTPTTWIRRAVRYVVLLMVFAVPATGSILVLVDVLFNGQGGIQGLAGASGVAVSHDGRNVYAVGAIDDAVSVFSRDPETGLLSFLEFHQDGVGGVDNLRSPTDVAVSQDGRHVYVTSDLDDALTVFRRTSFGRLSYVDSYVSGFNGVWGIAGASAVSLSHDGSLVFVTGGLEDSLAVFSRDATSDTLVFADVESSYFGAAGLVGASDVVVSPDNRHVYTTADIDNSIAIFAKDPTQDAVFFVDWLQNGANGVAGLAGASGIAIDEDGGHVFATGRLSNAVAVFSRDSDTGLLQPETVYSNSQTGISGLAGASDVVLDRSSELVCVTGSDDDSVVLFRRATDSAELEFTELLQNGAVSEFGLGGASAIAAAPDGDQLYVTGAYDDALVTIATTSNVFIDGFETGDPYRWDGSVPLDGPP